MYSPDNDGLSSVCADSGLIHSSDLLRSSDFECSSESVHIDDNSESCQQVQTEDVSRILQSCRVDRTRSPRLSCFMNINPYETSQQVEAKPETSTKKRRLRVMDEDSDGVRLKIIPCVKEQFRQRTAATKVLEDVFDVPNRAQLMLNFLQKHGDRVVKETSGPRKRFPSTLKLVQHVLRQSSAGSRK